MMVFAGFNVLASKIAACIIGVAFLATLYWAKNWIARLMPVLYAGLVAGFWIWDDGTNLPYVVLFLGVMCSLQSLWDFQGLMFHKHPESDASKFAELCGCCPAQCWGFIWMVIGLALMCGFALLGIVVF
jgi:hypothetical protein